MDRFKAFVREKGLYLLCLAVAFAATAAGILALRRVVGHLTGQPDPAPGVVEQPDTLWEQPDTAVEKPVADIPKPTQTPAPTPTPTPEPTPEPTAAPEPAPVASQPVRQMPAWYGKPIAAFTGDELVYSETLGDWRTHNGTDYTVPEGKAITPAVGGTVTAVRWDSLWGSVVEVTDLSDPGGAGAAGDHGHGIGADGQHSRRGARGQPPAFGVRGERGVCGPGGGDGGIKNR